MVHTFGACCLYLDELLIYRTAPVSFFLLREAPVAFFLPRDSPCCFSCHQSSSFDYILQFQGTLSRTPPQLSHRLVPPKQTSTEPFAIECVQSCLSFALPLHYWKQFDPRFQNRGTMPKRQAGGNEVVALESGGGGSSSLAEQAPHPHKHFSGTLTACLKTQVANNIPPRDHHLFFPGLHPNFPGQLLPVASRPPPMDFSAQQVTVGRSSAEGSLPRVNPFV